MASIFLGLNVLKSICSNMHCYLLESHRHMFVSVVVDPRYAHTSECHGGLWIAEAINDN